MRGAAMVVAAGCFWGMSGTLQAFAPPNATSTSIGAVRVFGTGLLFLTITLMRDAKSFFKGPWPIGPVLLAGFGLMLYQLSFFAAARMTGAGVAAIIAIGASPAMAGAMSRILFKEHLSPKWYVATVMAVSGGALLVSGGIEGTASISWTGVLLALTAGFAYALQGVGIRMIGDMRDSFETVTAIFVTSGILALPFLISRDSLWMFSTHGLLVVFMLAVVTSALPFYLFTNGLLSVGVAKSYTLALSEPLTAWLLSTFLLHERLAATALVGVAVICCAILLLATDVKKK